jgi:hypothetical protein
VNVKRVALNALLATGIGLLIIDFVVRLPPLVYIASELVSEAAVLSFYWLHCAGPALYYAGATPIAMRVVKGVGIVAFGALAASLAVNVLHGTSAAALFAISIASNVWYLAGWPLPNLVGRLSGGIDAAAAAQRKATYERSRDT